LNDKEKERMNPFGRGGTEKDQEDRPVRKGERTIFFVRTSHENRGEASKQQRKCGMEEK